MNKRIKQLILLTGDISILYLSLYLSLFLRYRSQLSTEIWQEHILPFSIVFIIWIFFFYLFNLYNLHITVAHPNFLKTTGKSFLISSVFSLLFFYIYSKSNISPKTNLAIFIGCFAVLFFIWRRIYTSTLESYLPRYNIAIIGRNDLVPELVNELKEKTHLGYKVSFVVDVAEKEKKEINGAPIFNTIKNLPELIKSKKISHIILTSNPDDSHELRSTLFACLPFKINFINLVNFYEDITGRIPINVINKMWFLENLSEASKHGFDSFKRFYDFILAVFILIISLPFWLIIAIILKIESRGPVFFTQVRSGKNGKEFKIIKFRTMKVNGNDHSPTSVNDNRITRFGNFLRKSRLDEIPQVINIIKGEMSFVGPRPERPELIVNLEKEIPFYRERMLAKPGLTGWDQVSGEYHSPSVEDTMKKLQYDLYYIKNRSVYLDLSIIIKTVKTVFMRAGR